MHVHKVLYTHRYEELKVDKTTNYWNPIVPIKCIFFIAGFKYNNNDLIMFFPAIYLIYSYLMVLIIFVDHQNSQLKLLIFLRSDSRLTTTMCFMDLSGCILHFLAWHDSYTLIRSLNGSFT